MARPKGRAFVFSDVFSASPGGCLDRDLISQPNGCISSATSLICNQEVAYEHRSHREEDSSARIAETSLGRAIRLHTVRDLVRRDVRWPADAWRQPARGARPDAGQRRARLSPEGKRGDAARHDDRTTGDPKSSASLFAALGDKTRFRLVSRLCDHGPMSIARLTAGSKVTRQAITKHLRVMEEARLVRSTRHGRESVWQLDRRRLEDAR